MGLVPYHAIDDYWCTFWAFQTKCVSSIMLGKELSIDESMVSFKGGLIFKQYAPKKPTKWGMKAFVLADSQTGYIYNWRLYTGKYTVQCTIHGAYVSI